MKIKSRFKWVARDGDGGLRAFVEEPEKNIKNKWWNNFGGGEFILLDEIGGYDKDFAFVLFSDERATPINSPKEDSTKVINKPEMVNKPLHYIGINGLEVEQVLQEFIPKIPDSYIGHRVGSATEYILRAYSKNGLEDIEKAIKNLQQVVEYEKRNAING